MLNVVLYLRKNQCNSIVWVRFYIKREKVHFSTKVTVAEKDWSKSKSRVLSSDPMAKDKNLILENILARLNNVFVKFRLRDRQMTKASFMRAYARPSDFETFYDFVKHTQSRQSARIKDTTLNTEQVILKKLETYAPSLAIDEIDQQFLDEYFAHLLKIGNNRNTAFKNMTVLRKYARAAYRAGYLDTNPFEGWTISKGTPSMVYLTEEELAKLVELYKAGHFDERHHNALEVFLFLCFSSLHIGDAKQLMLEQFTESKFTYYRLKLSNRNPKPIVVPTSTPLMFVLHNIVGTRRKGKVFEHLPAEQTINYRLKTIARVAGIDKNLTLKVGRHTFATIFLRKTKDLATLKEIMGHSEFKETLVYAHVIDEAKIEGVETAFNSLIDEKYYQ